VMEQTGHASGTLMEYPLIADVDNDGSTEFIVASNDYAYSGWHGISVIGDADSSWAPARPIWNQYAYFITNVNNDGSIPAVQTKNWLTWNNFRTGGTELGPSDWLSELRPGDPVDCLADCGDGLARLYIPVENGGLLDTAGFTVAVYPDVGSAVATFTVTGLSAGTTTWVGELAVDEATWGLGELLAVVDDGDVVAECDETDNAVSLGRWPCD